MIQPNSTALKFLWKVEFEHKGTDDDSGFLIVGLGSIYFNDGFDS